MLFEQRQRAGSFGEDAEQYDRSRPTYPSALVDALMVDRPARVLDVGCGTGIASALFLERGCQVLGVEPDDRMAEVARRRGLEVEVATFETWEPGDRRFDLVVSGQAWHWVDPVRGAHQAARVLREGGRLGLFWNVAHPPPDLKQALDALYDRLAPGLDAYSVMLGNSDSDRFDAAADGARESGRFEQVTVTSFGHDATYTTAEWLDQLPTHSDHRVLGTDQLAPLLEAVGQKIDDYGGSFVMHYETVLVGAVRVGDAQGTEGASPPDHPLS